MKASIISLTVTSYTTVQLTYTTKIIAINEIYDFAANGVQLWDNTEALTWL